MRTRAHPGSSLGVGTSATAISPLCAHWSTCLMQWPPAVWESREATLRRERSASKARGLEIARFALTNLVATAMFADEPAHGLWAEQATPTQPGVRKKFVGHL